MGKERTVLVLGMHRSGTSYLASVLAGMGVRMGDELLAADRGNPRGYFEDRAILSFHKRLLASRSKGLQTRADFLPGADFNPDWNDGERAEALALVRSLRKDGPWGWKEPRTCLFVQEWLRILPDAACVAVYRHPLDIFHSFLRRGDWSALFAPESVFAAGALYNRNILAAREADPERFLILNASASFADSRALVERLAAFLGLDASAATLPEFASSEFSSVPVSEAAHELFSAAYPGAAAAYEAMQKAAEVPGAFVTEAGGLSDRGFLAGLKAAAAAGAGQSIVEGFCMALPDGRLAALKASIAADVDAKIAELSAQRNEYVANFEKYKALYDNYFTAWQGSDRTLAETRAWIERDLMPKIERWRAQLRGMGVPFDE